MSGEGERTVESRRALGDLVDRDEEVRVLEAALTSSLEGMGRVVLLAGEAGIGKSRLAQEMSARARRHGALVLTGSWHETEGGSAYLPWVEMVRACADETRPQAPPGYGAASPWEGFPDSPPRSLLDSSSERVRLFDGFTTFFRRVARTRPLVLVLENLHEADLPSLMLLGFLSRRVANAAMLVLMTLRKEEIPVASPQAATIADILLQPHALELRLRGLSREHVAALLEQELGRPPTPVVLARIYESSEGNPLFVRELAHLLAVPGGYDEERDTAVDSSQSLGIHEVIGRRLARLPARTVDVLRVAAVIGREFDLSLLARALKSPRPALLETLEATLAAGVTSRVVDRLDRHRFSHALIRDVLYRSLSPAARADAHARIADAIEDGPTAGAASATELAHHHGEAARLTGRPERAVEAAELAGHHCLARCAYEDAIVFYDRALALLTLGSVSVDQRARLLVAKAEALRRAGDAPGAKAMVREAVDPTTGLESPSLLARAALAYGGMGFVFGLVDRYEVTLLERALRALKPEDGALRAQVMARLATALSFSGAPQRCAELCEQALELARHLDDTATQAYVLYSGHAAVWQPDNLDQRLEAATEALRLAEAADDREQIGRARHFRIVDLAESGAFHAAYREMDAQRQLGEELRQPLFLWHSAFHQGMRALLEGRFAEAERHAEDALAIGQGVSPDAPETYAAQLFGIRREQGRLLELEEAVLAYVAQQPTVPVWRCGLATTYAETGRMTDARQAFDLLAAADFTDVPRDISWLCTLSLTAQVCAALGDVGSAGRLYDLLLPHARQFGFIGAGVVCTGATAHYLGLLAGVLGRWPVGLLHFETALAMHRRAAAWPWAARTQVELGRMLLTQGRSADRPRARALLLEAKDAAARLGMHGLAERAAEVQRTAEGADRQPHAIRRRTSRHGGLRAGESSTFRREGEYWTIVFGERTIRLRDSLGLQYLAELLRRPAQEILALELVAHRGGNDVVVNREAPNPLIDDRARATYRARVRELRGEIADAEERNDLGVADRMRRELEALQHELARHLGIGGRRRDAPSAAERARVNVTRTIKQALRRIAERDADLGRHLSTTIRTGLYCQYCPDPRHPLRWTE